METETLLRQLGESVGLGPLQLDESGACSVEFGEKRFGVQFTSDPERESIWMISRVGRTPVDAGERLPLLEALLEANWAFQGTLGATFTMRPETGDIYLIQELYLPTVTVDQARAAFLHLVQAVNTWVERLLSGEWQTAATPNNAGVPSFQLFA